MTNIAIAPKPFLIRTPLAEEVSLRGYVSQLAKANSAEAYLRPMLESLSETSASIPDLARLSMVGASDLAARGSVVQGEIFQGGVVTFGKSHLPKGEVRLSRRQICPKCVAEGIPPSCCWELVTYDVCHIHKCQMVRNCNHCGKAIAWTCSTVNSCSCSVQFSDYRVRRTRSARSRICALLAASMRKSLGLPPVGLNWELYPPIDRMLLLIELISVLVLPAFWKAHLDSKYQCPGAVSDELIADMLEDRHYRQYLSEHFFLHAALEPKTMSQALKPGNTPDELSAVFQSSMAGFSFHKSLWLKKRDGHVSMLPKLSQRKRRRSAKSRKKLKLYRHRIRLALGQCKLGSDGITWYSYDIPKHSNRVSSAVPS